MKVKLNIEIDEGTFDKYQMKEALADFLNTLNGLLKNIKAEDPNSDMKLKQTINTIENIVDKLPKKQEYITISSKDGKYSQFANRSVKDWTYSGKFFDLVVTKEYQYINIRAYINAEKINTIIIKNLNPCTYNEGTIFWEVPEYFDFENFQFDIIVDRK